jgi:hypothetical protein
MRWIVKVTLLWMGLCAVSLGDDKSVAKGEKENGFVSIFDGKSLDGWTGAVNGYKAEDGSIVCIKEKGGNLYTEKEYADFILRFEFKLEPAANNGIGIRAPLQGDAAYVGMEIQVLDDTADAYKSIRPYQHHGSVYGVAPAEIGHLKPVGEWNAEEITAVGRRVRVVLNSATIVDVDLDEAAPQGKTIDGGKHPGLKRDTGHIGFLGHGSRVEFRNLRVKEIEKK